LVELAGAATPPGLDGLSLVPTLLGDEEAQRRHEYLYWEFRGGQAVRYGDWKGIRWPGRSDVELYDLATDIGESHDVARDHPRVVARIEEIMRTARTESELFPLEHR
jgi:arylsulfatase A-like enzyme